MFQSIHNIISSKLSFSQRVLDFYYEFMHFSMLPTLIFIRIDHFASCASIIQSVTSLNKKSDLQSVVF